MLGKKRRATAPTTAPKNKQLNESYQKPVSASTKFRELAANLLFGLQAETLTAWQCRHGWKLFEVVLRQYYGSKTSGGLDNG